MPQVDTPPQAAQETPQQQSLNDFMIEVDGQLIPNYDATMVSFEEGDVVTGKVVRIDKDEVLVDIGYKSEGVIPQNELSIRRSIDPAEEVHLGEEVDALVLTKEDQDGRLILSKKRARFERAWRRIEAAAESGEPVEGTVIEVVKGGLIIDLGVRGFLPASLVDIRRVQNLDEYLGQKIECKVIELNRSRNNVVLSRRAVLEEERKEARQQILDRLERGQVVEGTISNIVDFGAFVDLDGIDGLIHISELSWGHVNHPSEVLNIGDTVAVKVLDIDRDRQRISLGLKQTQEDPWERVVRTYNVGDVLEGKVTKVVSFGAFVEIMEGVEGLVHISELAQHHVENPREVVEPGDEVKVKILEIDEERRRLSLSLKRVEGQVLRAQEVPPVRGRRGDRARCPDLGLSEEVFAPEGEAAPAAEAAEAAEPTPEAAAVEAVEAAETGRGGRAGAGRGARRAEEEPGRRTRRRPRQQPSRPRRGTDLGLAVRRLDRRPWLRQVRGAGRLRAAGAATLSSDAVVHELLGTDEVRDLLHERWGERVVAGERGRPRSRRRDRVRAPGGAGLAGGCAVPARRGCGPPPGGSELERRDPPPESRSWRCRCCSRRASRSSSTRRSRSSPTRRCAPSARRPAATRASRAARAAAHAGREGRACRLRDPQRRLPGRPRGYGWRRCWTSCERRVDRMRSRRGLAGSLRTRARACRRGARRGAPAAARLAMLLGLARRSWSPARSRCARWSTTRSRRSRCRCATRT